MKCLFATLLLFLVASPCLCARITPYLLGPSFNVMDFGAKGDGQTDDSQAFLEAWQHVCNATHQDTPTLLIPEGKNFMLQPVSFMGPCNPTTVKIELEGTITAPNNVDAWKFSSDNKHIWVQFSGISGLVIGGKGTIDGQGAPWWNLYGDKENHGPTALHFHNCVNMELSQLTHLNSPKNHISINKCNGSYISHLHIMAPADSPNTDGIDISGSFNITIQNSQMETGDDCIAINGGSSFININGVYCGPGHGISVGSLGKNGAHEEVEEVYVQNCIFNGTSNGARIKTWVGGSGYARNITFENIKIIDAKHPVIIDQQYDPHYIDGETETQAVKVSDITYRDISGTSASKYAVELNCDVNIGCTDIVMEGINITSASQGQNISASCTKAQGTCSSCIPSVQCLS